MNPEEGDEYQARLRLTETNKGFGNQGSIGESYRGSNPSQIIDSISRDIAELRSSINELDSVSANRNSVLHDINNLRDNLGDKIQAARDAINGKVAQGENQMVISRLRAQLDKAVKDEKQLLEQLLQKQRKHSVRECTLDSSYPSSGAEGKCFDGVDQGFDQVQVSGLEQREKESQDILNLERDILDLNEMHRDLNKHINDQGETVDRIDQHTDVAAVNVSKGTEQTGKIRDLAIKNRRMKFIIIAVISGIVLFIVIVIIIIGAYFGTRNN